ncbi:MAG: hypothetical protein JWN99_2622 [Ilumatobacteraceae bacterium]|nr:hypothetical protein [Ilumatobacteraceae bacterium]
MFQFENFLSRGHGHVADGTTLRVRLRAESRLLVDDVVTIRPDSSCSLARSFELDATDLGHLRESLLWTPEHPVLGLL